MLRWITENKLLAVADAFVAVALLDLVLGCSYLMPGTDVRQAMESKNSMVWDANGTATIKDETTHSGQTLLAEGDDMSVTPGIEGGAPTIDGATNLFWRRSKPKEAGEAYMHLATQNARVTEAMIGTIRDLAGLYIDRRSGATTSPGGNGDKQMYVSEFWKTAIEGLVQNGRLSIGARRAGVRSILSHLGADEGAVEAALDGLLPTSRPARP